MSKLNELIQQYCPDGVEYKQLESVTRSICSGLNPRKNFSLNISGANCNYLTVKEMASGKIIFSDKTDKITKEAASIIQNRSRLEFNDILLSGIGTIGRVAIVDIPVGDWNCSESVLLLKPEQSLIIPKYLKYILEGNDVQEYFNAHATGSTLKGIRQKDLRSLEIPVPPLPVQEEIVRILDTFTELQAELQAELQKRKQQYNFYRDNLLSFEGRTDVEWKKLGEVAYYVKDRVNSIAITHENYVSVENLLQNRQGKTVASNVPNGSLIHYKVGDVLIGNIRPYLKKIWLADVEGGTNGDVLTIRANGKLLIPRFLYQCLASDSFFQYDMNYAKGAKMPRGSKEDVLNYMVPIISLAEQQKIVDILDRFDTLVNDLTAGLPAEIEKRRQQYEYYRDKLLTFKRKEA